MDRLQHILKAVMSGYTGTALNGESVLTASTDERMMTSIPGLFAAGDVRSQLTRQVTTAVGDATTAAIAVEKYLAALRERAKVAAS